MVVMLVLLSACQPRAAVPQQTVTAPIVAPPVATTPAPSGAPPPPTRSNCGLATPDHIDVMPVFHGHVVVQKDLGGVRLRGVPKLISEPEDFSEYYLGQSAVDPKTVPAAFQAMRGAQLHVLRGSSCQPKLGAFSALAWADEDGYGWSATSPAKNAARAFKKGQSFLVAQLDVRGSDEDCDFFSSGGLVTLNPIDGYRDWSKVVDEYDRQDGSTRRAIFEKALATLPAEWLREPFKHMYWTKVSLSDASLLILELRGGALPGAWLGVWCEETDESIVPVGAVAVPPDDSNAVDSYRHNLWVIGREGSIPLIFYAYFGLEPSTGRYAFFNPSIGPAPRIEDALHD